MTALPETFNPADIPEDDRNFDPLPAGQYKVQVIESKIEDTKSGTGQMLTLTLEVLDGPFANRRLWDRLNVRNQNPEAQRIALRGLADLCLILGIAQLRDTDELHFKPFTARVGIRQDKTGQYGPQNTIRYSAPRGGGTATPGQAPASQGARPAGGGVTPPARPWGAPAQQAAAGNKPPF